MPKKIIIGPKLLAEMYEYYMTQRVGLRLVGKKYGYSYNAVRTNFIDNGLAIRSCIYGLKISMEYRESNGNTQPMTPEAKEKARATRLKNAVGYSLKPNGYCEITIGEDKFKSVHRKVMEDYLGRKLSSAEVVHHKNHNRSDNRIENLIIMSRSEHQSLHAKLNYKNRKRKKNGTFA